MQTVDNPHPPPIPSQVENETDFCHVAEMTMYIIINKNKTINGTGTNFIFKFVYANSTLNLNMDLFHTMIPGCWLNQL